jgi:hypothetical protein
VDAADLGGGEDDVTGPVGGEEGLHVGLAGEVEVGVGADDDVGEAEGEEAAEDRGADEAPVAGDEDLRVLVGEEGRQRICGGQGDRGGEENRAGSCGAEVQLQGHRGLPAAVTVPMSPEEVRWTETVGRDSPDRRRIWDFV